MSFKQPIVLASRSLSQTQLALGYPFISHLLMAETLRQLTHFKKKVEIAMVAVKNNGKNGVGMYLDFEHPVIVVNNFEKNDEFEGFRTIVQHAEDSSLREIYYIDSITHPSRVWNDQGQNITEQFFQSPPEWFQAIYSN